MGKQHNKAEKKKRRLARNKRKNDAINAKTKAKPAKKA
ncbi:hypothetical protein Cflav_PD1273 [Pedosphaera parvula Ellin514]|uniref:Uncharacterized protein n=1 Tax=Pedosphaera parvula (strain Ellin514) TaxID=320771 RepID=B9XP83_PEDPL|nr:hypothetical protein Cflav_PD1273 [Pedosphaera parvula Ellin514]